MKKDFRNRLTLALLVALAWAGVVRSSDRVVVESPKPFKATVEALKKALQARGMMIVATIDHQNMLRMVGTRLGGSVTIEFGKPDMGKMVLPMSPEAGLEMPAKIYVYEKGGKVYVSYYEPNFAQYSEQFADVDRMMRMTLQEVVAEATR